jgi:glutathione synthase/RimK-type ligase-like ATP-grasp enzyme
MKELLHIGTIESVSLPDDRISDVLAKVDTGADSSCIWASNIHLEGEKLFFNFFAPGSVYYREEPVVSTAFRTTVVRNSFGHEETRYKIRLKVTIGDRSLRRWFSLADRSRNTYPILLGKNFLKNTFVVNVAEKHLHSKSIKTRKVAVLSNQSKPTEAFFAKVGKLSELSVAYECAGYDALVYYLDGLSTTVVNAHDHDTDLAAYDYVYFKSHGANAELAAAAAQYLHFKSRPFADHELGNHASYSKLTEYMKLNCFGLPVPPSICALPAELRSRLPEIVDKFGYPFVMKEASSDRGQNNYLITKEQDFYQALDSLTGSPLFIVQKYIPNDGFMRIYVVAGDIGLAIWRDAVGHSNPMKQHLNKPHGSDNAKRVAVSEVPDEVRSLALLGSKCLGRQVAGVDLLQDKITRKWYILEVNNAPQLRSGSFPDEKVQMMADFFDKELR